jgi:hypothetical protein
MTIDETIQHWLAARETEIELSRAHSGRYDVNAHYAACDVTSKWVFRMINHPDWTFELHEKYYPMAMEDIAYPVSC